MYFVTQSHTVHLSLDRKKPQQTSKGVTRWLKLILSIASYRIVSYHILYRISYILQCQLNWQTLFRIIQI